MAQQTPQREEYQFVREMTDLGLGSKVIQDSRLRILNRNGTFNVSRAGLPLLQSLNLYRTLLSTSWWKFLLVFVGLYIFFILLFSVFYILCGPDALVGGQAETLGGRFIEALFLSVHTITTVGYGHIAPRSFSSNILVMVEAFVGLSGFAIAAALMFARFSRPVAKIQFSESAVIGPHHGETSFMFRIANGAQNELLEVQARILLSMTEVIDQIRIRRFYELELERQKVAFFPLDWTVVHHITDNSPLHGVGPDELARRDAEFLILVNAIDDTFHQVVQARTSYRWDEVVWGAKFRDMYRHKGKGQMSIDLKRIHDIQHIETPVDATQTVWDF
jgi:inward rectifier potassium channel